ncbi:hypothetical protein OAA_10415 [Vibrio cyclitrophicus 1F175]|nr:hypothetical protein [Vibrio cyclitrophicus]OEF32131.1 hypothetical protein OA7_16485 [Vibrio cyclitrophicus 1F53]OEF64796.1 hypothetical protein OAA_10415 [Vibrio cyclitrophicus 1F175]PMH25707.1 hypothetical protein BCU72_05480 [Vibrio cyclitrophicus]PMH80148.1 hypothetical protein BCU60_18155 [Vibrio cyclitrophicus]PMJ38340.1 hypothetical protein BCU24_21000 [Vibrio cyclitrophicus]
MKLQNIPNKIANHKVENLTSNATVDAIAIGVSYWFKMRTITASVAPTPPGIKETAPDNIAVG